VKAGRANVGARAYRRPGAPHTCSSAAIRSPPARQPARPGPAASSAPGPVRPSSSRRTRRPGCSRHAPCEVARYGCRARRRLTVRPPGGCCVLRVGPPDALARPAESDEASYAAGRLDGFVFVAPCFVGQTVGRERPEMWCDSDRRETAPLMTEMCSLIYVLPCLQGSSSLRPDSVCRCTLNHAKPLWAARQLTVPWFEHRTNPTMALC
jgi:hypothetical protein